MRQPARQGAGHHIARQPLRRIGTGGQLGPGTLKQAAQIGDSAMVDIAIGRLEAPKRRIFAEIRLHIAVDRQLQIKISRQPQGAYQHIGADAAFWRDIATRKLQPHIGRIIDPDHADLRLRGAGDGKHIYVSNRVANTISKIDMASRTVVESYAAPGGPDCMDVSADGRYIYVGARWARKLLVIDTVEKKVIRSVNVGKSPHGVWTLNHAPR